MLVFMKIMKDLPPRKKGFRGKALQMEENIV